MIAALRTVWREIDGTLWWWKHCIGVWARRRTTTLRNRSTSALLGLVDDDIEPIRKRWRRRR